MKTVKIKFKADSVELEKQIKRTTKVAKKLREELQKINDLELKINITTSNDRESKS